MDLLFYGRQTKPISLPNNPFVEGVNYYVFQDDLVLKRQPSVKIFFVGDYKQSDGILTISHFEMTPKNFRPPPFKVGSYIEMHKKSLEHYINYTSKDISFHYMRYNIQVFYEFVSGKNKRVVFEDDFMVHYLFRLFGIQPKDNVIMRNGYGYICLEAQFDKTFDDVVYIDPHEPSDDYINELYVGLFAYIKNFHRSGIIGVDFKKIRMTHGLNYLKMIEDYLTTTYGLNKMYVSYITNKTKASSYFLSNRVHQQIKGQVVFKVDGLNGDYKRSMNMGLIVENSDILIRYLDFKIDEKKDINFVKDFFITLSKKINGKKIILELEDICNYGLIADCVGENTYYLEEKNPKNIFSIQTQTQTTNIYLSSVTNTEISAYVKQQIMTQLECYDEINGRIIDYDNTEPIITRLSNIAFKFTYINDLFTVDGVLVFIYSKCTPIFKINEICLLY